MTIPPLSPSVEPGTPTPWSAVDLSGGGAMPPIGAIELACKIAADDRNYELGPYAEVHAQVVCLRWVAENLGGLLLAITALVDDRNQLRASLQVATVENETLRDWREAAASQAREIAALSAENERYRSLVAEYARRATTDETILYLLGECARLSALLEQRPVAASTLASLYGAFPGATDGCGEPVAWALKWVDGRVSQPSIARHDVERMSKSLQGTTVVPLYAELPRD